MPLVSKGGVPMQTQPVPHRPIYLQKKEGSPAETQEELLASPTKRLNVYRTFIISIAYVISMNMPIICITTHVLYILKVN